MFSQILEWIFKDRSDLLPIKEPIVTPKTETPMPESTSSQKEREDIFLFTLKKIDYPLKSVPFLFCDSIYCEPCGNLVVVNDANITQRFNKETLKDYNYKNPYTSVPMILLPDDFDIEKVKNELQTLKKNQQTKSEEYLKLTAELAIFTETKRIKEAQQAFIISIQAIHALKEKYLELKTNFTPEKISTLLSSSFSQQITAYQKTLATLHDELTDFIHNTEPLLDYDEDTDCLREEHKLLREVKKEIVELELTIKFIYANHRVFLLITKYNELKNAFNHEFTKLELKETEKKIINADIKSLYASVICELEEALTEFIDTIKDILHMETELLASKKLLAEIKSEWQKIFPADQISPSISVLIVPTNITPSVFQPWQQGFSNKGILTTMGTFPSKKLLSAIENGEAPVIQSKF